MKILHVSNYLYPHIGGIEQTARDILNCLAGEAEQRVICFNGDKNKKDITDEVDGIKVVRCGTLAKVSSQAISSSFNKCLKQQFKEFKPDVVVFHFP
ncbi:MAG: glycosyl transferase, partial [Clostridia bacterium]|nr:glycosyl transferase [Clostridia bacterium]